MNEAQKQAIRARQRQAVQAPILNPLEVDEPERPPAPVLRPMSEVAAELREALGIAAGRPVTFMRFIDRTMQVWGMQSGDTLTARTLPNGQEHRAERVVVDGSTCFLVTFINPGKREVLFDFVEPSAVRSWRAAT